MECSGELKDFKPFVLIVQFIFTLLICKSIIMNIVNRLTAILLLFYIVMHVGTRFVFATVKYYFHLFRST